MELRDARGLTEAEYLAAYHPGDYPRPSVTVDMIVFAVNSVASTNIRKNEEKELEVLLIQRKNHPFIQQWAIPGGFVDIAESIEDAAKRELLEETGIQNLYLEQLYTWGSVNRDPRMRVISTSYMALINREDIQPRAGDDAADVAWFRISLNPNPATGQECLTFFQKELGITISYDCFCEKGQPVFRHIQGEHLAFDHVQILYTALTRLRNKIEYTPIVFSLMPEEFTLSALQKVYETILGRKLLKANFRKKVAPMVIETGKKETGVKYRPGKYYRYNESYQTGF